MDEKTNAQAVPEQRTAAEPNQAAPPVSGEATLAHAPSTDVDDSCAGPAPASKPPTGEAEQRAPTLDTSLSFLQPGTQPGSLGRLGHFEVLALLGQGGFGIVLKAFDDKLQRMVAIKVLGPQLAGNPTARSRFVREARSAAAVNSKHVVSTYEVMEQPIPHLVMEYIAGKTLQDRIDQPTPFEIREILRIGAAIAAGLAAAHQKGLIHRDIKPANILLTESPHERVTIADFGLARAVDDASLTQSGAVAGTPLFMSPEQARGETLDHRSDLFSLGSVLYTMCTGQSPFRAARTLGVMKRVCDDAPRPIREINAGIPDTLAAVVNKLLEKNPAARFQTAEAVADLLTQLLARLDESSLPSPSGERAGAETTDQLLPAYDHAEAVPLPQEKARRRAPWLWAAAACVLLVAAGALLPFLLPHGPPAHDVPKGNANAEVARPPVTKPGPVEPSPTAACGAGKAQEAWAKRLGVPVEYTSSLGMKFRLIPPGTFIMGSSGEEIDRCLKINEGNRTGAERGWHEARINSEAPAHEVEITQPFYLGATHVTVGQFRQFVDATKYPMWDDRWEKPGWDQTDDHPVVFVAWNDAVDFCDWLSRMEGQDYRLPTEAEWEYSCRAGTTTRYWFGDDDGELSRHGWFNANSQGRTHPVRQFAPNPFGLYDMHGNAWQWCLDGHDPNFYKSSPRKDPQGDGDGRLIRGGSWGNFALECGTAFRNCTSLDPITQRDGDKGFRAALSVDAVKQAAPQK